MSIRFLHYYRIPDPFAPAGKILYVDKAGMTSTLKSVKTKMNDPLSTVPKVFRVYISADSNDNDSGMDLKSVENRIRQKEIVLFRRIKLDLRNRKTKLLVGFIRSLLIGYLLWIAPEAFWAPLVALFDNIAHGLSDYARMWVILFGPVKSFIRVFGSGLVLTLPHGLTENRIFRRIPLIGRIRHLGFYGLWHHLAQEEAILPLQKEFGVDRLENYQRDVEDLFDTLFFNSPLYALRLKTDEALLKKVDQCQNHFSDLLNRDQSLSASEWMNDFLTLKSELFSEIDILEHDGWGEELRLVQAAEQLLFSRIHEDFHFASIHTVQPGVPVSIVRRIEGSDGMLIEGGAFAVNRGYPQISKNLSCFYQRQDVRDTMTGISKAYSIVSDQTQRSRLSFLELQQLMEQLSFRFEYLRNEVRRLHLGTNPDIPNEKGEELTDFYHHFALCFGKAAYDLDRKKCRRIWGHWPVKTRKQAERRVSRTLRQVERILSEPEKGNAFTLFEKFTAFWGRNGLTASALCLGILFLFGSLFSFSILTRDTESIARPVRFGYGDRFLSRGSQSIDFSEGIPVSSDYSLIWRLPYPLDYVLQTEESDDKTLTLFLTMGEHYPESAWEKFMESLSGPLGVRFDVLRLTLHYSPVLSVNEAGEESFEKWLAYNYDGKGERRLLRDISERAESWRAELLSDFKTGLTSDLSDNERELLFGAYFKDLADKGILEAYIRRSFSQTSLSTHIFYGSPMERLQPGFEIVLSELDRQQAILDQNRLISSEDRAVKHSEIEQSRQLVQETFSKLLEQGEREYGALRQQPELLNQYTEDLYSHLAELRDFESIWMGMQGYVYYLFNKETLETMLKPWTGTYFSVSDLGNDLPVLEGLIEEIKNDSHLGELIKIRGLQFELLDMGISQLNMVQGIWKDLL